MTDHIDLPILKDQDDEISSVLSLSLPDSFDDVNESSLNLLYNAHVKKLQTIISKQSQVIQSLMKSDKKSDIELNVNNKVTSNEIINCEASFESSISNEIINKNLDSHVNDIKVSNLQKYISQLQESLEDKSNIISSMNQESLEHQNRIEEFQRNEVDLLEKLDLFSKTNALLQDDKIFLLKENEKLKVTIEKYSKNNDSNQSRNFSLELKINELTDQLLHNHKSDQALQEERFHSEINKLREEYHHAITEMKSSSNDMLMRENRLLRDNLSQIENDCDQLKKKLEFANIENSQLVRELALVQTSKCEEITDVRAELKLKSFELSTLGIRFEERMTELRDLQLENETIMKELDAHKNALHKCGIEFSQRETKMKSNLESLQNRVSVYEALELEVDEVILSISKIPDDEERNTKLLSYINDVKTSPQRRIFQSVNLSQKLTRIENEKHELFTKNIELKKQIDELECSLNKMKSEYEFKNQPTSFLVKKLLDTESQTEEYKLKINALEEENAEIEMHRQDLIKKLELVKGKMKILLDQRSELLQLQKLANRVISSPVVSN